MYRWGNGLDRFRKRIADGEDKEAVLRDVEAHRDALVREVRPDNASAVRAAIDAADAYVRGVRNPSPCISDAW